MEHFAVAQSEQLLGNLAYQIGSAIRRRDAGSIHDLRVSIRRFTQALKLFRDYFGTKETKRMRRRLKGSMSVAGELRDVDIALKLLSNRSASDPDSVRERLQQRRKETERRLVSELKRWRAHGWSAKWRNGLRAARATNPSGTVDELCAEKIAPMVKKLLKRGSEAARKNASSGELHEFRITAKGFRYTLEIFSSVYGARAGGALSQITAVQDLLGAVNDCRIVRAMVSELGGDVKFEAALKRRQLSKTQEFRKAWKEGSVKSDLSGLLEPRPRKPVGRSGSSLGARKLA